MKKRKPRRKQWLSLPNGTCTTETQEFVDAWRGLAKVFTDITGGNLWAFCPDICICDSCVGNYSLPARLAVVLAAKLPHGEFRMDLPRDPRLAKEPLPLLGWRETGLRAIARETKKKGAGRESRHRR